MIDVNDKTIQELLTHGFKLAAHVYLRPDGQIRYSVCAKHPETGRLMQGWSSSGTDEAIRDLERRAGGDPVGR